MPKGARKYAQDEASSRADGGAGLSARQHRRAGLGRGLTLSGTKTHVKGFWS